MIISASQIKWTSAVTSALVGKEKDSKSSLKSLKEKQVWNEVDFIIFWNGIKMFGQVKVGVWDLG